MSARPKWMPSEGYLDVVGPLAEEHYLYTGLRAQIAVLEEMIAGQTGHWVDRIQARIAELREEMA